jgi:hypothetical protein
MSTHKFVLAIYLWVCARLSCRYMATAQVVDLAIWQFGLPKALAVPWGHRGCPNVPNLHPHAKKTSKRVRLVVTQRVGAYPPN